MVSTLVDLAKLNSWNLSMMSLLTWKMENNWSWIFQKLWTRSHTCEKSDYVAVESGVPQGSALGSSLFLYYINDIPAGLTSTIRLFADDTIAYLAIKSNRDALTLQQDLDTLSNWETNRKMAFYPDKCNVIPISRSCRNIFCLCRYNSERYLFI